MDHGDVVIAGGGAVGSAVAYFLAHDPDFQDTVTVVEPDPAYRFAASTRSASSIRRQFSTPLNIALSAYGWEFLRALPEAGLTEGSYLNLALPAGLDALRRGVAVQQASGVTAHLYAPAELAVRYPWLNVADLGGGATTDHGEGWFDGYGLLMALRAANERAGVRYLRDTVEAPLMRGNAVTGVRLASGAELSCRWFVVAAGTRSPGLAVQAGIDLPVVARKRCVFVFTTPAVIPRAPLLVDTSGVWCRPERDQFICGPVPDPDPDVDPDDFEVEHALFESLVWPALAHRVPAFEALRVTGSWAGHYDYNTFDQNAFLGPSDAVPNLLLACGFSGHGLQHAPGVGRALAEHIVGGAYRSIDVAPFSHRRYTRGEPLAEFHVI